MSVITCAPEDSEDDETAGLLGIVEGTGYTEGEINTLVKFGVYVRETAEHVDRMCDLIAGGNRTLRHDLALVAKFLWP